MNVDIYKECTSLFHKHVGKLKNVQERYEEHQSLFDLDALPKESTILTTITLPIP